MSTSNQKQLVLISSLGLTALLVGGLASGLAVWRSLDARIQDPQFLQEQLQRVSPQDSDPNAGPPPAPVRVGLAQRKTVRPQRPIIGRLVEVRKVTVASEVTGKITAIPVEEGTPVIGGRTVLARVDDVWSRFALERCQSQVASSEAKLKYEQLELEREQKLIDTKAISRSELESRQAAVADLEAGLAQAKVAVKEEQERITRSAILAPFDGTVIAKRAEVGGHVAPGTPIVDIVSRGQVDARLMVPESMINLISVKQTLPVQIDPIGVELRGSVVSVTPYGPTASRTFPVRVRLDDQAERLKVGMSVTALVATGPEREALVVSRDAVLVRPDGATVWVAVPGQRGQSTEVQPVPVAVSDRMQDEYAVEPQTGKGQGLLTAGTRVVVEGAERLTPGQRVRIITLEGGPAAGTAPQEWSAAPSEAAPQTRPATPAQAPMPLN